VGSTELLFASPSFLTGMGRVLDLFGEMDAYNVSPNEQVADYIALLNDWKAVGGDLTAALRRYAAAVEAEQARQLPLFP
jgi:hypothetical protein